MYPRRLFPIVEVLTYPFLSVSVCVEIDRASRYHTYEVGPKSAKESFGAFDSRYRDEDLESFANVKD